MLSLLLIWSATGCYFFYPKIPSTPRPEVVEGKAVEILSQDNEYMASCDPTRDRKCGLTSKGEFKKKSNYVTVRAEYDGRTLNQFELRKLVDPDFDKKLARVRSNKGVCNISLVPSVISVVGLAALTIAGPLYDKLGDKALIVGLAASGTAAGGALLSYPLGGFACRRARRQYNALFIDVAPDDTEFILRTGYGDQQGNTVYVDEMLKLTEDFNKRFAPGGPGVKEPPSDETEESQVETSSE